MYANQFIFFAILSVSHSILAFAAAVLFAVLEPTIVASLPIYCDCELREWHTNWPQCQFQQTQPDPMWYRQQRRRRRLDGEREEVGRPLSTAEVVWPREPAAQLHLLEGMEGGLRSVICLNKWNNRHSLVATTQSRQCRLVWTHDKSHSTRLSLFSLSKFRNFHSTFLILSFVCASRCCCCMVRE